MYIFHVFVESYIFYIGGKYRQFYLFSFNLDLLLFFFLAVYNIVYNIHYHFEQER